jgi:hypothetical protein
VIAKEDRASAINRSHSQNYYEIFEPRRGDIMKNLKFLVVCLISFTCITVIFAQSPTELYSAMMEKFNSSQHYHTIRVVKSKVNPDLAKGMRDSVVVVFNDPNLEQVVREALGKPTGYIYDTDMASLTSLNAWSRNISDLTGLEYAINLTYLYLFSDQISDITALQNLTSLTRLRLYTNLLDNEDLTNLYNLDSLTYLDLTRNPGIISGTAVQTLADNLDLMDCIDILWNVTCGADPNLAVISWVSPPDFAAAGQTVTVQATATDSGQAEVKMKIDWGDGNISDYSQLKSNGSTFEFTHSYSDTGNFDIRVIARNEHGVDVDWSNPHAITIIAPTTAVDDEVNHFYEYKLCQNYPNPFNKTTIIKYSLKEATYVNLSVYDISGRRVKTLVSLKQQSGEHTASWDGTDNTGKSVTNGIYHCL